MTRRASSTSTRALTNVVVLAVLSGLLVGLWLLFAQDAADYWTTPLAIRGYEPAHKLLRPSGTVGHTLGFAGTLFIVSTLAYVARRRVGALSKAGSLPRWLEVHIFCGVFGPLLVTFHTSFKFNGLVSVAYWSMVLVVVSGFVGRYLYVRIPKTIRGEEMTRAELEERAAELQGQLAAATKWAPRIETVFAGRAGWREVRKLRREIRRAGVESGVLQEMLDLARERALLLRRIARLERTRRLFQLWHVFHRPFVWVLFAVLFVHVGVALYFGYMPFGG